MIADSPLSTFLQGDRMNSRPSLRFILLFIDLAVLALCIAGVEQSRQKAWIGVGLAGGSGTAVVESLKSTDSPLRAGDELLAIGPFDIRYFNDVEQILDRSRIGNTEKLTIRREGATVVLDVKLTPYYSTLDLVIQASTIGVFFFLALLVLWRQPGDTSSLQFHHLAVLVATVLAFTAGRFTMEPYGLGHLLRALLPLSNAFIGSAMLHFALIFPASRQLPRPAMLLLHLPAAVVAVWGFITSIQATQPFDLSAAPAYYAAVSTGKAMLGIGAVASVAVFILNFVHCRDSAHRRQIAWAMTGATLSTTAFLLWQLSTSNYLQDVLPHGLRVTIKGLNMAEAVLNGALLVTATFMAIGIVRYRMFNIELILKRGTVYTLVLLILILVNAAILSFGIRLVGSFSEVTYFLIMSALTIDLLLFIPTRALVQRVIDRYFFRIDYDFREALRRISEQVLASVQAEDTAQVIVNGLNDLLQLTGVMVLVVKDEGTLQVIGRSGFSRWKYPCLTVRPERLRRLPQKPLIWGDVLEPGAEAVHADTAFARRYNVSMLFPIRTEEGVVIGLLVLGNRRSGIRFTLEDVDLIRAVTVQAGLQFERLLLQQRLLIQRHEAEKLRELNRIKSFFVSGVSHDLKTPLTSISMFAELLENQLPAECGESDEARRSLAIIQGECGRLARLIDNVLDFTRIERGMVQYEMVREDLNDLARRAFDTMAYQLRIGGFDCRLELHPAPLPVKVDAEAILQALNNLLGNAMKYSGESRGIILRTDRENGRGVLAVQDFGLGIKSEDVPHLFEPFFRSHSDGVQKLGGVGLGLSLVKHIVDAHAGNISVESAHGEGSTFRMNFVLLEEK
jgi:signal transduction histidine kinase